MSKCYDMKPEAYFAHDEHGIDHLPWPLPADVWLWQIGDVWVATIAAFHEDWWEGCDEEDLASRPTVWSRPIWDVPQTGVLSWTDCEGMNQSKSSRTRTKGTRFAGVLTVTVSVPLDTQDDPITTHHDLARLLLSIVDTPLPQ